jgi:hypothetical protein
VLSTATEQQESMVSKRRYEQSPPTASKWTMWRDLLGLLVVAIGVALLLSVTPGVVGP